MIQPCSSSPPPPPPPVRRRCGICNCVICYVVPVMIQLLCRGLELQWLFILLMEASVCGIRIVVGEEIESLEITNNNNIAHYL